MIRGIGIDLVELESLKELVSPKLINRILSEEEKKIYDNLVSEEAKIVFLGGRYAAKEALFKAVKTNKGSTTYSEFSILNNEDGTPVVKTNYFKEYLKGDIIIHLTLSHTDNFAVAYVVLENK